MVMCVMSGWRHELGTEGAEFRVYMTCRQVSEDALDAIRFATFDL